MVFSSLPFLFFYLPAVLAVYRLTPLKLRNLCLLAVSLLFYGWGEPVYISIMLLSIAVDYTHGILVERWRDNDRRARMAVASSVFFNLAILVFFKYWDFLAKSVNSLTGLGLPVLGLPLPIGISFYTFQTMSYTIDVYRQAAPVQRDPAAFGAYVTLFPQLIAGPIVQYRTVADQLKGRTESMEKFVSGVQRFSVGLAKKVLLANAIGQLWDGSLAAEHLTMAGAWLGLAAYAFQIYFDFSGYSDMAIGLGRMFGFAFLENFNYPYISRSVVEFWRRWHISLTTWFREYVYFPLGGNRVSRAKWVELPALGPLLRGVDAGGAAAAGPVAGASARGPGAGLHPADRAGGLGPFRCGGHGPAGGLLPLPGRGRRPLFPPGRLPSALLSAHAGNPGGGLHAPGQRALGAAGGAGTVPAGSGPGGRVPGAVYRLPGGCQLQSLFIL